jgi:hypothetical protein
MLGYGEFLPIQQGNFHEFKLEMLVRSEKWTTQDFRLDYPEFGFCTQVLNCFDFLPS